MNELKHIWHYLFAEPFTWIFYCFFQPSKFSREFEVADPIRSFKKFVGEFEISSPFRSLSARVTKITPTHKASVTGFLMRIVPMLRLALPMFLISYPFELVGRYILLKPSIVSASVLTNFLLIAAGNTAFGIFTGIAASLAGSIAVGIVGGISVAITVGIAGSIAGNIIASIALGIAFGITFGIILGIAGGIAFGAAFGITGGIVLGIAVTFAFIFTGGITGVIVLGIVVGVAGGIAFGGAVGKRGGIGFGITVGITGAIAISIAINSTVGIEVGVVASLAGIISYLFGYYRLLLYPVSGFSAFKMYRSTLKHSARVFTYLHRSSLYWDECVFLPLPGLKRTLLIATEQDIQRTLEEIVFIVTERPQQMLAARAVSLEIALCDLEMRVTLAEIAGASQSLAEILPSETGLVDPQWVTPLARLSDASRDAAHCCSPIGRQERCNALKEMITNLRKVHPKVAFKDQKMNSRLIKVVGVWLEIAQREQKKLEHAPQELGRIDNPYKPGRVLPLSDTLFVGRRDLAQQLEEALSKGDQRHTFLLNGERRMGKSSTLTQLPNLLGSRNLPVFYDLQQPGVSSNIAYFLGTVAAEIYKVMAARGMKVRQLEYEALNQARKENEAVVYQIFTTWLTSVESVLDREARTLLLTFDEFEALEEAGRKRFLDLSLLLSWFRSIIQYHPRLVLLFSGVHTLGEMSTTTGINWAGYFVNVQTLKVSFLKPDEALQLITEPITDFPSENIFGEGVVDKIIAVTGRHPFLIQAICSVLIDNLNAEKRDLANVQDVEKAANKVMENWWDGFFWDLWVRTDESQRSCLIAVNNLEKSDIQSIMRHSNLDEKMVRRALQTLLKRDLVTLDDGYYCMAAPFFSEWVQRSLFS